MFKQKRENKAKLEAVLGRVLGEMDGLEIRSSEFTELLEITEKLNKIKSHKDESAVSKDVIWTTLGSLAGIATIIAFEKSHVVTTKALGFIKKA